jgi:hypothetical protein
MTIWREKDGAIVIAEIDENIATLLHMIGPSADGDGNSDVTDRLFPTLTGGREPEAEEDWREYVTNDLEKQFRFAQDAVQQDLAKLAVDAESGVGEIRIPADHLEQWISALNQARLAIAARHHFTEREMEQGPEPGDARYFPRFQLHVYGLLLEYFVMHASE